MATKNDPGKFDCYAAAAPDEPIFVLRADDELAPILVRLWAGMRGREEIGILQHTLTVGIKIGDSKPPMKIEKYDEAIQCASDMEKWKQDHGK